LADSQSRVEWQKSMPLVWSLQSGRPVYVPDAMHTQGSVVRSWTEPCPAGQGREEVPGGERVDRRMMRGVRNVIVRRRGREEYEAQERQIWGS